MHTAVTVEGIRRPVVGLLALIIAIVGLSTSVIGPYIAEAIQPRPRLEERLAGMAADVKDALLVKMRLRKAQPSPIETGTNWHHTMPRLALSLGLLGLIGGVLSYLRGERRAYAVSAAGLAAVALAWQGIMLVLGAIAVITVIIIVLGAVGFDLSP